MKIMDLKEINSMLSQRSPDEQVKIIGSIFPGKVVFTTSFGIEDQVITHMIFGNNLPIEVVTLDTGRLFHETYKVFEDTVKKYQKTIRTYFPDHEAVERIMTEKGPFSFHDSKENRMECCGIRKVEPLNRALKGMECWISGLRAAQSENRSQMEWLEYDEDRKIFKFYPLFYWSSEKVRAFIEENNVPFNVLHDSGYVSIGCEPCTRAIKPGEDFRAGRWWWETDGPKECGCHLKTVDV